MQVVLTDYPDQALVDNMTQNVAQNIVRAAGDAHVTVLGYIWGRAIELILEPSRPNKFDLILLSDLVFNHSQVGFKLYLWGMLTLTFFQHRALLWTCEHAVARGGCVLVFFTHHKPHLAERDLAFFEVARETGWACEKVLTERFTVGVALHLCRPVVDARLAYVPGGNGRGGGAVYGARVEAHAGRRRLAVFVFCRRRSEKTCVVAVADRLGQQS